MRVPEEKFKEFLLDSRLVSKDELERAIESAKKRGVGISDELVSEGKLNEDDLRRIQASVLGIPFVNLEKEKIDFDILSMIPEPIARNHNIVAFRKTDKELEVAMLDVDDLKAIDFIKKKVGLKILPRLTNVESIKFALKQYQKSLKAEFSDIIKKETASLKAVPKKGKKEEEVSERDLKKMAERLPVVRIVDTLIKHAIIQDASDIHIEPGEKDVLVRYRIDGILHDAMTLPKDAAAGITARIKVLSNLKLDEKRLPQDGRFKVESGNERVSFRVSTLPTYFGEKTVMRLLRETASGFTLEGIGFHGVDLERIHNAVKQRVGMILATGPTGSGKTTTLYTILDILNTPNVNISTIEDPIEYQMSRVNQTQVKPDIGLTFGTGLRSLVRQDPDIIMVGEIRDNETATLAINAALTGHLVLSTLHTNSASGAIPRLLEMNVEPFLLVSTLKVVIGQRLVRVLCEERDKHKLSSDETENLRELIDTDFVLNALRNEGAVREDASWSDIPFYKPRKSRDCEDGYKGRLGIHEVLEVTQTVNELIMRGATTEEVEQQAHKEGMMTMIEDGIFKAAQGITTIEEVLRVVSE